MSFTRPRNPAQFSERFMQITALGIGLAGLAWMLEAAQSFVPPVYASILDHVSLGLGILVLGVVGTAFVRFKLMRARHDCQTHDSFIWSVYRQSAARSFSFVIVVLVAFKIASMRWAPDIAPEVLIEMLFAVIAMFFAGAFFLATGGVEAASNDSDGVA